MLGFWGGFFVGWVIGSLGAGFLIFFAGAKVGSISSNEDR